MSDKTDTLLCGILSLLGRQTFSPERLAEIVLAGRGGAKQLDAFNLCDGTRTQGEITKALKLDAGNFSRTVSRWVRAGVLLRLVDGKDARLLHIYPLPEDVAKVGAKRG